MNYLLLSETLDLVGSLLIAYTVIMVHYRFWREHKIDGKVFLEMRREQMIGIVGVIFILAGYLIKVIKVIPLS